MIEQLTFFMSDFERARQAAESFDDMLLSVGLDISSDYAELLALTTRQVFGSLDIALALGSDGKWNISDTMIFMKNMGAVGSDSPYVMTFHCFMNLQSYLGCTGCLIVMTGPIALIQLIRCSQLSQPFFTSIPRLLVIYLYHFYGIKIRLCIRNNMLRKTLVCTFAVYPCHSSDTPLMMITGSAYPNATADSINRPHQFGIEGAF